MKNLSLTWRILIFSFLFGLLPVFSWFLTQKAEQDIEKTFQASLELTAKNLGLLLEQLIAKDQQLHQLLTRNEPEQQLPVALRKTAILIDGFADEWYSYENFSKKIKNFGQQAKLTLSEDENYLYGIYEIEDDEIIYRESFQGSELSDKILLTTGPYRIQFWPLAPGRIAALRQSSQGLQEISAIYAQWQESSNGYQLEFRIPQSLVGDTISTEVHDVDIRQNTRHLESIFSFTQHEQIILGSQLKLGFLQQLQSNNYLISLADPQGNIKFQYGNMYPDMENGLINRLWQKIEPIKNTSLSSSNQLPETMVKDLAGGQVQSKVINSKRLDAHVIQMFPLKVNGEVAGALVIESTPVEQKLSLRNLWFWSTFILAIIWLLVMSQTIRHSRQVSKRIRYLRDITDSTVTESGQISKIIEADNVFNDEVADLNNSFSFLTQRLQQYQDYQDKFIARLSHELRTPIAIVRSSLDNLSLSELPSDDVKLLQGAQSGVKRLSQTLTRLSEANRLEQAISQTVRQDFDMTELLNQVVKSYQLNWPKNSFELDITVNQVMLSGSKELFVQMLDKVVSNAVDFSEQDKSIKITLQKDGQGLHLIITNSGPKIEKDRINEIFNILHSSRKGEEGHLGLGLYVARLIAQFHKAKIFAKNLPNQEAVSFIIYWKNNYFTHKS